MTWQAQAVGRAIATTPRPRPRPPNPCGGVVLFSLRCRFTVPARSTVMMSTCA